MENALKDIRDAEKKAKKMIEDAENSKADIVSKARHESLRKLSQEKEAIDREKDAKVQQRAKETEKVKAAITEKGKKEADKLEKSAKNNVSKAEALIIRKFEEMI